MNASDERSTSLWMDTARLPSATPLRRDIEADVVIVGSGIVGLSTAYELAGAGKSVVVLDRGALGGGMTSRTSAHLTTNIDDLFQELIRVHGLEAARAYYRRRVAAVDRIEEIQRAEKIDCDFARLDGYLFPAKADDAKTLEDELKACRQVGMKSVKWVDETPIPSAGAGRSLRFPEQARFHPRKYLAGLIRCIKRDGGRLFGDTAVVSVEEKNGEAVVTTERGPVVRARAAIVATNSPINNWVAIHTKQTPYRS